LDTITEKTAQAPKGTIPTPPALLLRRLRYQVLPIATLALSLVFAGWLWQRRGGSVTATGSVNSLQINVNAKIDGLLVELPRKVQIFDSVTAGEVLARLDSSHIEAQIQRETDRLNEVRRQLEMLNKVKSKNPTTAPTTGAQGSPNNATASAVPLKGAARSAILKAEVAEADDDELVSNPMLQNKFSLEMMASSYQAKIQELEQKVLAQDIKAPISGTVVTIHRYPGQAVNAGQAIMTIASEKGEYIVTYVRQTQVIQPTPGMAVNVHLRSAPRTIRSHVQSVGPAIEKIPPEHLRDPRITEWGLPVHISIPPDTKLRPGELVDLFFRPHEISGT
jgi:multidrug resistance efflux pump